VEIAYIPTNSSWLNRMEAGGTSTPPTNREQGGRWLIRHQLLPRDSGGHPLQALDDD
jgi:hypothetical protein